MTDYEVQVYTRADCQPCKGTKRTLLRAGVPFSELSEDSIPKMGEVLADQGFRQLPVVMVFEVGNPTPIDSWSGFKPTKCEALALLVKGDR